jgi:multidrug resistance efflux pump
MKTFYLVCIFVIGILAVITFRFRSEATSFYGIADTKEIVISTESSVEIKRIRVTEGQSVKQGDTLVELFSQDLDMKISQITHELGELKVRKAAHVNLSRSEIRQIKSQQEERINNLRAQVKQLESQYEINKKLVAGLKSIKKGDVDGEENSDMGNPITLKIESLKSELERALDSSQITIDRMNNEMSYSGDPLGEQVKQLEDQLKMHLEQRRQLYIVAQIKGLVGAVNFKDGEKVSPFTPIATLHAESPSYIRGYIHENVYSKVITGQKVSVQSLADKNNRTTGEIIGVGSRIVEYPVRLRRNQDIQIWGREIMIRIPPENAFLLGEKVLISLFQSPKKIVSFNRIRDLFVGHCVYAAQVQKQDKVTVSLIKDIRINGSMKNIPTIEASGALYCADLKKYCVISDETQDKKPALYIMDTTGYIEKEVVISGLDKINDMEAITGGGKGIVYIAASQSYNTNEKLARSRTLFLRVRRAGEVFTLDKSISLFDCLRKTAQHYPQEPWARFLGDAIDKRTIDIEGIFWREGSVFLGFKNPLLDKKSVIMVIKDIDRVFDTDSVSTNEIAIWQTFSLKIDTARESGRISDLYSQGNGIYILSCASTDADNRGHSGTLWVYNITTTALSVLWHFTGLKPEGITYNNDKKEFLITFDNGSKYPSRITTLRIIQ